MKSGMFRFVLTLSLTQVSVHSLLRRKMLRLLVRRYRIMLLISL